MVCAHAMDQPSIDRPGSPTQCVLLRGLEQRKTTSADAFHGNKSPSIGLRGRQVVPRRSSMVRPSPAAIEANFSPNGGLAGTRAERVKVVIPIVVVSIETAPGHAKNGGLGRNISMLAVDGAVE